MLLHLTLRKEICLAIGYYRVLCAAGGCGGALLYESKESWITPALYTQLKSSTCKIDSRCLRLYLQLPLSLSCLMGERLMCWCGGSWRWASSAQILSLRHPDQGSSFSTPQVVFSLTFGVVRTLLEAGARRFAEHLKVFSVALSKISVKLGHLVCGIRAISEYLDDLYYSCLFLEILWPGQYYYHSSLCLWAILRFIFRAPPWCWAVRRGRPVSLAL